MIDEYKQESNFFEHNFRRLQARQARETGICPIREELYSQCFDELIRQVTLKISKLIDKCFLTFYY